MRRQPHEPLDSEALSNAVRILAAIRAAGDPQELGDVAERVRHRVARSGLAAREIERKVAHADVHRVRIRYWNIMPDTDLAGVFYLIGIVEGHPSIVDGHLAVTSAVVGIVPRLRLAVTASGRLYELLEPIEAVADGLVRDGGGIVSVHWVENRPGRVLH